MIFIYIYIDIDLDIDIEYIYIYPPRSTERNKLPRQVCQIVEPFLHRRGVHASGIEKGDGKDEIPIQSQCRAPVNEIAFSWCT